MEDLKTLKKLLGVKMKDKILKFLDQLCCSHEYKIIDVQMVGNKGEILAIIQCEKCGKIRKVERFLSERGF